MSIIKTIKELLDDYKSSQVLTIELERIEKLHAEAVAEISALREENVRLAKAATEALKQVEENEAHPEFFSYQGAKFQREGRLGEVSGPYCPTCIPMGGFATAPRDRLICLRCHTVPVFGARDIPAVLAKVRELWR
jgi:hypothetical protein